MKQLSYSQRYYLRKKAEKDALVSNSAINTLPPEPISFDKVKRLNNIHISDGMLKMNKTGLVVDTLFSYEGGIPVGTNIMCTGDPGVGKTTLLLHTLSCLQLANPNLKCLFVCAEMSKIQMFKYMKRFPVFGNVETIFTSDYLNYNSKEVIEQLFNQGYDYILIDSIVEVLESVKEDAGMSQGQAEKWLIDLTVKHNEGNNDRDVYTTFLLIQQVTKAGVFVGSNKLKHITDAHMEMKRDSERDGGGTYIMFSKNRNGQAGVKFTYQLSNNDIYYGTLVEEGEESEAEEFSLSTNE
jgi:predicted ATP-dependent serine protease